MLFVALFREPFRMMVMHPVRTIADPPIALVPGVMFVVVAAYHHRRCWGYVGWCWGCVAIGRIAIGRCHMARFFDKAALEREHPKH
jgi:hypothetical protein